MKVYCVQDSIVWENKLSNFKRISSLIKKTKIIEDSLIVFPEMFATGFSLNVSFTSANEPNLTETFLTRLAKETKCWVIAGLILPNKKENKASNCAVTFDPSGKKISEYAKMHLIPILGENDTHKAGDKIESFPIRDFQLTPAICYDLRFPEFFRSSVKMGTDLFVVIACWPKIRIEQWVTLLRARAIENQAYVVGVNRIGEDPQLEYGGRTLIIDPFGEIIADGEEKEGIIEAWIEKSKVDIWRDQFPAIKDIRNY
jgi:omega-amidase